MAKYIDADKLIETAANYKSTRNPLCNMKDINGIIAETPAEDVAPVIHGRWGWDPNGMDWNLGAFVCSECGCLNHNLPDDRWNPYMFTGSKFCPNCGAKMDKEEVKS